MDLPFDSPDWLESLVVDLSETANRGVERAKTSDEAMKAAGGYALARKFLELLSDIRTHQETEMKGKLKAVNARS